jgi:hypothetical protein
MMWPAASFMKIVSSSASSARCSVGGRRATR